MVNAGTKILGRNQFVIGQGTGGECHDVGNLTVHAFEIRLKVLIICHVCTYIHREHAPIVSVC